jgi:hypothetical protein
MRVAGIYTGPRVIFVSGTPLFGPRSGRRRLSSRTGSLVWSPWSTHCARPVTSGTNLRWLSGLRLTFLRRRQIALLIGMRAGLRGCRATILSALASTATLR